jgi:hypothetical protein
MMGEGEMGDWFAEGHVDSGLSGAYCSPEALHPKSQISPK